MGFHDLPVEKEDIGLDGTPQYDSHENVTQNEQSFQQLQEEFLPTHEIADQYLCAEILLPRGFKMARGCVVAHSHFANRNIMGRAYANPILYIILYHV